MHLVLTRWVATLLGMGMCAVCLAGAEIKGESVVLAGRTPARLLWPDVERGSVVVRDSYDGVGGKVTYEEGKDYVIDYPAGTIARIASSRIPDFATNVLYGKEGFDHSKYPGYGNGKFFAWVDYRSARPGELAAGSDQADRLRGTRAKLEAGGTFKVVAFGDSIMAGGEASRKELQFPERWAAALRERFPKAVITVENGATGGDTSAMGLGRLEGKVLTRGPDLALVGFGMNDHNLAGVGGVEPEVFKGNLIEMVRRIRERTGAEVVLLSTFPPNPKWAFGTHRMGEYAAATRGAAREGKCAYADVYGVWEKALERKDAESLLGNDINHPNDFGHWLYFEALAGMKF